MTIERRGTAALGDAMFDASHPLTGVPVRVLAVNDDNPDRVRWLVAFTDKSGRKICEQLDAVALPRPFLGKPRHWEW